MNKRIDGKKLADDIAMRLAKQVKKLKKKNDSPPTLAVLQVGDDPPSSLYIRQKKKCAKAIGGTVRHFMFPRHVLFQRIAEKINELNFDPTIHGIIVQQPLPSTLTTVSFNKAIALEKDVDGFCHKTPFIPPVAQAVLHVLRIVYEREQVTQLLKSKSILIIGRGTTGGKPIAKIFSEKNIPYVLAHSQTTNTHEFAQEADIIISCVGKRNTITSDIIKEGALLIGVGITREKTGRIYGDYNEKGIEEKAFAYTPTPGGIGPLTVVFLMKNLVQSYENAKS